MLHFRPMIVMIAILAFVDHAGFALAGEYQDPSGFSFNYPDGWTIVRHGDRVNEFEGVHPEVARTIKKNNFDLKKIAVTLVRIGPKEFPENVSVTVGPYISINADSLKAMSEMPKKLESQGLKFEDVQTRIQRIGVHRAIVAEYRVRFLDVAREMKQKQIMISAGDKTYWVGFTAPIETYEQYAETFDAILASFKTPAPFIQTLLYGLIGSLVVIAAVVVGIREWFGGKAK
jgi:hypothetical protein